MEEFEGRRRGLLTVRERCNPISKMSHHMKKGVEWGGDWAREV